MKYMIMTFGKQQNTTKVQPSGWVSGDFMAQMDKELRETEELVETQGLVDPHDAKTVGYKNGSPVAVSGSYVEPEAALAGYWIVDVKDEGRAVEIASQIVDFIEAPVEVRRVADASTDA